jgi:hypothetical protein
MREKPVGGKKREGSRKVKHYTVFAMIYGDLYTGVYVL